MGLTDYEIRLDNFTGPLDLLLFFIRQHEIDIMDIPIAQITEEYLAFIEAVQILNITIAGEFIVMAATLMRIKARMLLPVISDGEEEDIEDPRTELVQRLLEYQRFKEAAENLGQMAESERIKFPRPENLSYQNLEEDPGFYLENVTIFEFIKIFKGLLEKIPPVISYEVEREEVTVKEKIAFLLTRFVERDRYKFSDLFPTFTSRQDLIATFIAILELMRDGQIKVTQRKIFDDFALERISISPSEAGESITYAEA